MTEKEKMLAHELYDANFDAGLVAERQRCKELCFDYNGLRPGDGEGRRALLARIVGRLGKNPIVEPPFWCDYGWNIRLGDNFYANHGLVVLDAGGVAFGDNVFLGPGCGFHTAGHPLDAGRRNAGLEYAWPITVGSNVWIGAGVHVLPGVSIGDDTVVGAGSVVTRSLPAGVLAAGNPCRVIRELAPSERERSWAFEGR